MHETQTDLVAIKYVKPTFSESPASSLLNSEIWNIGKDETSKQEGAAVLIENLPKEEARLKSYLEKQINKYRPSILAHQ